MTNQEILCWIMYAKGCAIKNYYPRSQYFTFKDEAVLLALPSDTAAFVLGQFLSLSPKQLARDSNTCVFCLLKEMGYFKGCKYCTYIESHKECAMPDSSYIKTREKMRQAVRLKFSLLSCYLSLGQCINKLEPRYLKWIQKRACVFASIGNEDKYIYTRFKANR